MEDESSRHSLGESNHSGQAEEDEDFLDEEAEDDEATLDEEEGALDEQDGDELDDLEADNDIPIEELRRRYGYGLPEESPAASAPTQADAPGSSAANENRGYFDDLDDGEGDVDYEPPAKEPRIDELQYQADIPAFLCPANGENPPPPRGALLWSATQLRNHMSDDELTEFLAQWMGKSIEETQPETERKKARIDCKTRDDEDALLALLSAGWAAAAALSAFPGCPANGPRISQPQKRREWTDSEVEAFEAGLLHLKKKEDGFSEVGMLGKDFPVIQDRYLPGRTIGELVEFYYSWKKSDRLVAFKQKKLACGYNLVAPHHTHYMENIVHEIHHAAHDSVEESGTEASSDQSAAAAPIPASGGSAPNRPEWWQPPDSNGAATA